MPYQVLPLDSSSRILGKDINPDLLPSVRMNVRKCLSSDKEALYVWMCVVESTLSARLSGKVLHNTHSQMLLLMT